MGCSRDRSIDARDRSIEEHLPIVDRMVDCLLRRRRIAGLERDDLIQDARIGLIRAIDTFDPQRGANLVTHIGNCIRYALAEAVRGCGIRITEDVFSEEEMDAPLTDSTLIGQPDEARSDAKMLLENALPQLKPRRRAAVLLHAEGHSKAEISRRLSCSERHAGRLVEDGLADLRAIIGEID